MANFNINLARGIVSSTEERRRFWERMLIYLSLCGAALVYVASISAININRYLDNRQALRAELATMATVSGLDASTFNDPEKVYGAAEERANRIGELRRALEQRIRLLPVIQDLFSNLPADVGVQSLAANAERISFALVMPPSTSESGDMVRDLRSTWEQNEELMARVSSIRPGTAERRKIGDGEILFVQFECLLKK